MVHATLTGVSAVYDANGARIGSWLGTGASEARVYEIPLAHGTTPYVRYGDWAVHAALETHELCERVVQAVRDRSA